MKHFFTLALTALFSTLAMADFVGMEYEAVAETANGTTYRVYATFDNPTDELVAVYALETAPMIVGVSSSFYQDPVGAVLAQNINPLFFASFPTLQYDSWFTIGSEDSNGTSDVQQVGMDQYFEAFEAGGGFTIDTFIGGSWFLLPNQSADAEAGADGRVLIGQFTTEGVVNLTMNFQWDNEASDTFNSEGVSLTFPEVPVPGCTNPAADNYNAAANEDDGSCTYGNGLCTGLSYDLVAADPLGTGESTYRIYANFTSADVEVTAMYGTDTEVWSLAGTQGFYQDALGSDFGGQVNPLFFGAFPTLEYDTWWTIGAQPGDADGLNSAFDQALTSFADWNSGGDFVVNTFIGGSIFVVPGANGQGNPVNGRVLLGQVTTSGVTDAVINLQVRDANQESFYASGMTLTFPVAGAGCNNPDACNFDANAEGDADCVFPKNSTHATVASTTATATACATNWKCWVARTTVPATLTSTPPKKMVLAPCWTSVASAVETTARVRAAPTPRQTTTTRQQSWMTALASSAVAPTPRRTTTMRKRTTTTAPASSAVAPTPRRTTTTQKRTTTTVRASSVVAPTPQQTTTTLKRTTTTAPASSAVAPTPLRRTTTPRQTTTMVHASPPGARTLVRTITTR